MSEHEVSDEQEVVEVVFEYPIGYFESCGERSASRREMEVSALHAISKDPSTVTAARQTLTTRFQAIDRLPFLDRLLSDERVDALQRPLVRTKLCAVGGERLLAFGMGPGVVVGEVGEGIDVVCGPEVAGAHVVHCAAHTTLGTLVGTDNGEVLRYSPTSAESEEPLCAGLGARVRCIDESHGHVYVLAGGRLTELQSNTLVSTVPEDLQCFAVHPDGNLVAFGSPQGAIHLYSLEQRCFVGNIVDAHGDGVCSLQWHKDGVQLLSASIDGCIAVSDVRRKTAIMRPRIGTSASGAFWVHESFGADCVVAWGAQVEPGTTSELRGVLRIFAGWNGQEIAVASVDSPVASVVQVGGQFVIVARNSGVAIL